LGVVAALLVGFGLLLRSIVVGTDPERSGEAAALDVGSTTPEGAL
jgi:hypothetical protein